MKKIFLLFTLVIAVNTTCFSQSTLITPGSTQPNIIATSTTNGVVFPRMTTAQKNVIVSVSAGMLVYDTDLNCLSMYNGLGWDCISATSSTNLPTFKDFQLIMNPSGNAPLVAKIAIKSNQPIKISYTLQGQDGENFTFATNKFSADTSINVYALYPNYNNTVTVSITNAASISSTRIIHIQTDPVPIDLPQSNEITVNAHNPGILSQFILTFPIRTQGLGNVVGIGGYPMIIDTYGKVRGYYNFVLDNTMTLTPLLNDHWLLSSASSFREIDLAGNIYRTLNVPSIFAYHHDVIQLPNQDLVYLGESKLNNTIEDKIYTMNFRTGIITDSLNLYTILDPTRPQLPVGNASDWFHGNSITYDAIDNAILISGRQQSAVVKIDWATKQIKWILSDATGWNGTLSPLLLNPIGANFEQQWGQHSAILKSGDNRTMLLFDNGNNRSYTNPVSPSANYSRCVEYTFNETNKTVTQNFEFGKEIGSLLFAPYVGKVEYITADRFFIGYGGITKDLNDNASELTPNVRNQVRLYEVDRNQNVYFDISIKNPNITESQLIGFRSYRANLFTFK